MPPIERCPTGGYFRRSTTSRASAALSTCGMTIPSAPLSRARVAIEYSLGDARDRRDTGVERRGGDLRTSFERHDAVFHIEKQPVEAGDRHGLRDLDAAGH